MMGKRIGVRLLHLVMVLYLSASAIELLDRSGVAGEDSALADTADTLRDVRAGDDPLGIVAEVDDAIAAVRRIVSGVTDAGEALN